jgi:predicted transglutaminase-like protease
MTFIGLIKQNIMHFEILSQNQVITDNKLKISTFANKHDLYCIKFHLKKI